MGKPRPLESFDPAVVKAAIDELGDAAEDDALRGQYRRGLQRQLERAESRLNRTDAQRAERDPAKLAESVPRW